MKARGYTLVELLVVLVIVGIALAMVGVNAFMDDSRQLDKDARRLAALLPAAQDQSLMRGQAYVWEPGPTGYRFMEVQANGALLPVVQDDLLKPRNWSLAGTEVSIRANGQTLKRLVLETDNANSTWRIELAREQKKIALVRQASGLVSVVSP